MNADDDTVCPDGGTCHHECGPTQCFRVACCEPLSDVYPQDQWPRRVVAAMGDVSYWMP